MATQPKGALAAARGMPGEGSGMDDTAQHEGAETTDTERAEGAEEDSTGGKQVAMRGLFDLAVSRVLEALAQDPQGLDSALKADPVRATVEYGTQAVRAIAQAAEQAGKPIPADVLIQVGMQTIKELGAVANEKGYLPDEQIEVFLKEAFQQSLTTYAKLDMADGLLDPSMLQGVQGLGKAGAGALTQAQTPGGM